jgi:hypothetical protein
VLGEVTAGSGMARNAPSTVRRPGNGGRRGGPSGLALAWCQRLQSGHRTEGKRPETRGRHLQWLARRSPTMWHRAERGRSRAARWR